MEDKNSMQYLIEDVKSQLIEEPKIARIFENCYKNTLHRAIKRLEDGTSFAVTGDIPAMWLRDSAAQVSPYLCLAKEDEEIKEMLTGLVKKQFFYINIDPYANAFNEKPDHSCWRVDQTKQNPWVWERKFEIDSLCYPVWISYKLWKKTGNTSQFDENFQKGIKKILTVFRTEQYHETRSDYIFERADTYFTDTLSRTGKGALVKEGTGLIWSGFRPSDDACTYGYLIPSNMFAVVVLRYLNEIERTVFRNAELAEEIKKLEQEIYTGIETYGITEKEGFGKIYAYEVDGYGQYQLMDDANVPSLLSMEYLGYKGVDREVAANTRRFILSEANPYYYAGKAAAGIGSPHTPHRYIWHIALAIEGLTTDSKEVQKEILTLLTKTDGETGLMHEGFHADNPKEYTREWFSWANALFCELVLSYLDRQ